MAMPVGASPGRIAYEVPMGVVERGRDEIAGSAGWHFTQPNSEVRPREVQNFITAFDDRLAVTLSSSVSVCDFADPTTDPVRYPVLQPVLLASRKSCHGLGNWYLQPGDHHFHFSLSSHAPDWRNGWRFGIQSNSPLEVVAGTPKSKRPDLPEAMGFCSVSEPNVVVSAFKKAEDGNSIVLRAYDIEGRDTRPTFQVFFAIKRAEWTNLIEEEGRPLPSHGRAVALPVGHHAIETIKLDPSDENGGVP
jgi:alpha-mannosidase